MIDEYFFTCPYCWQQISMLLDLSVRRDSYVEDCEICCNPITISYQAEQGNVVMFDAQPLGQ